MVAFHVIDVSARDGLSSQNGVKGNIAYQAIERSANQWHKGDVSWLDYRGQRDITRPTWV